MSREGWNLGVALGDYAAEQQKRYTLEEAKAEIARRQCAQEGHYYNVLTTHGTNAPVSVICDRCGQSWGIESPEQTA